MRLILLIPLILCGTVLRADEWWAWASMEFWRQPPWTASVFLGNRLDTDDGAVVQIVSPRMKYLVAPWLDLGVGLSALSIENPASHIRYFQGRPELEINPKHDFNRHLRLEWRNRMEWRWNEGEPFTTHRSRHRLQLAWTFPRPVGSLTRIFASNEVLVDLHRHQWRENRLVPLGATFKISARADLDLFYMLLSSRSGDGWHGESVLGTYLRMHF